MKAWSATVVQHTTFANESESNLYLHNTRRSTQIQINCHHVSLLAVLNINSLQGRNVVFSITPLFAKHLTLSGRHRSGLYNSAAAVVATGK